MFNTKAVRKHLFVDPKVQGALAYRVAFYWFFCLLTISLLIFCWQVVIGPPQMFYSHLDALWVHVGPAFLASLLLLPMVLLERHPTKQPFRRAIAQASPLDAPVGTRRTGRADRVPQQ